jgi:hypothetical protein
MHRQLPILVVTGDARDLEQVLRDDVGLVVRWIPLSDAVARHRRDVRQTLVNRDRQQALRFLNAAESIGIDEPDDVFVHDIGGPLRLRIWPCVRTLGPPDELAETRDQPLNLLVRSPVARRRTEPRQSGYVLSKCQAGHEAVSVVPPAHVEARGRQAGAFTKHLEQAIVVQSEIMRVDAIELLLDGAACQQHCPVGEFAHDFLTTTSTLPGGEGA